MVGARPGEYMRQRCTTVVIRVVTEPPIVTIDRAGIIAMDEDTVTMSGEGPCSADMTACGTHYYSVAEGIHAVGPCYVCGKAYMIGAGLCVCVPWVSTLAEVTAVTEVPETMHYRAGISSIEVHRVIYIV